MKKFFGLFQKLGGNKLVKQYIRSRVLFFAIFQIITLGFSKKSLEIVRLAIYNKILCRLRRKNKKFIKQYLEDHIDGLPHERSNKIWICWLQGIDNAPDIVKVCYNSMRKNVKDKEIVLLDEDNYKEYVTFPEYVQEKIDNGIITRTHFSDLLRLELLIKYGGTWIDATVFLSGNEYPEYIFDSDLFLFRTLKPGLDGQCTEISSWLITSCTNNPILCLTQALMYQYWNKHKYLVDYFLVHDMFQLAIEAYPEVWNKVIPFSNSLPHILLLRLFDKYDDEAWNAIKDMTNVHKLSYKFSEEEKEYKDTYYSVLIKKEMENDDEK